VLHTKKSWPGDIITLLSPSNRFAEKPLHFPRRSSIKNFHQFLAAGRQSVAAFKDSMNLPILVGGRHSFTKFFAHRPGF
jgi:hypothetical protein